MLEYETANPGQDSSREEGEHFNPDLDQSNPRVAFAPEQYVMSGHNVTGSGTGSGEGRIGSPKEYGTDRRPFSDSPAPPHPNDQFGGLAEGGMHADEYVKGEREREFLGSSSSENTLGNLQPQMVMKPALKNSSGAGMANGKEKSVKSNTLMNRNMNSGIPRDDDFFVKE